MEEIKSRVNNLIYSYRVSFEHDDNYDTYHLNFENKRYRQNELAGLIRDSVPYFALTKDEIREYTSYEKISEINRIAWTRISKAHKNSKGDFGEHLLFILLSIFYPTEKFVTKVRLRSNTHDQIKGFDCAHFSLDEDDIKLWLGEAKFHQSFSSAVQDASDSIQKHANHDYINNEISILATNIEMNNAKTFEKLKDSLSRGKSIDELNFVFPILITYDCKVVNSNEDLDDKFFNELEEDLEDKFQTIKSKFSFPLLQNVELIFILLPLSSVANLKENLAKIEEVSR